MQTPRFENVSCSQCGGTFGPGEHGFSHCDNHQGMSMQTNDSGHVAGGSYPANYEILRAQLQHECFAEQLIEELIVAHRAHDDLVAALRDARERMVGSSPAIKALIAKTDAALAKAGAA